MIRGEVLMRRGGVCRFYNHLSNTERRIVHWGNLDEDEKQFTNANEDI